MSPQPATCSDRSGSGRKPARATSRSRSTPTRGATPQRCLWASTSVKDLSLRDTLDVEELNRAGDDLDDARGDDPRLSRPRPDRAAARNRSQRSAVPVHQLDAAGVDYDDVVATLEREGIDRFVASFDSLLEQIRAKRRELIAAA
jgi:Asp-tRNA(Asn)/Glu-tRNA(Gln) amidotransferase A subunit family amidase